MILLTSPLVIKSKIKGYQIKYNCDYYNIITINIDRSESDKFKKFKNINKLFIIENNKHIALFKFNKNPNLNFGKISFDGYIEAHIYFKSMYYITNINRIQEIQLQLL